MVAILLIIVVWIIFSSRYWVIQQSKSTFVWEQNYDGLCWRQYLGIKIHNTVLFKIPGKITKCI